MTGDTRTVRVWDGAIRLFHGGLVTLLMISVVSANRVTGRVHVLSGYGVATLLLFRLGWGVFGSGPARFAAFVRSPAAAWRHLRRMGVREPDTIPGHNPAGGWMVLTLLTLLAVQVVTGFVARAGDAWQGPLATAGAASRRAASVHAVNAWLIAGAAGIHVAAIAWYLVVKEQDLIGPMIGGTKRLPPAVSAPAMRGPARAAAALAAAAALTWAVSHLG